MHKYQKAFPLVKVFVYFDVFVGSKAITDLFSTVKELVASRVGYTTVLRETKASI
jgi:hypothetical protein